MLAGRRNGGDVLTCRHTPTCAAWDEWAGKLLLDKPEDVISVGGSVISPEDKAHSPVAWEKTWFWQPASQGVEGKILPCNSDLPLLSNRVTVLPYQSGTVLSGISVKNYDKCVFSLHCPLLTCRLLMTLSSESIISQLRPLVQTHSVF